MKRRAPIRTRRHSVVIDFEALAPCDLDTLAWFALLLEEAAR